jgi:hypothetical protein
VDFSKVNENIQRGEMIWQRMLAKGIKPTTYSMNHYLRFSHLFTLIPIRILSLSYSLFSQSLTLSISFCSLYSEALRINKALEIKEKFKEYGLVPDQYCYNSLIKVPSPLFYSLFFVFHLQLMHFIVISL